MTFSFKINGGKALDDALRQLGPKVEKRVAKSAVRAGAAVIAKEARRRAPVDSGVLKKSIKVVSRSRRVGDAAVSVITQSGKKYQALGTNAWYAPFVEFGTSTQSAQPFLRPALDSKKDEAIKAMAKKAAERINKLSLK